LILFADSPMFITMYSLASYLIREKVREMGIGIYNTAMEFVKFFFSREKETLWTVLCLANGAKIAVPYSSRVQSLVMGFPMMVKSYEAKNVGFMTSLDMKYRTPYLSQKSRLDSDNTDINVGRPHLDVLSAQFFDYDFTTHKMKSPWRIPVKLRGLSWKGDSFKSLLPKEDDELLSLLIGENPHRRAFPMIASLKKHAHYNMIRYMYGTETENESDLAMLYPLTEAQYFYLTFLVGYPPKLNGTHIYVPYMTKKKGTASPDYPVLNISFSLPKMFRGLPWDNFHDFKTSLQVALKEVIRWSYSPETAQLYSLLHHLLYFIYIPVIDSYVIKEEHPATSVSCNTTNKSTGFVANLGLVLSTITTGDHIPTPTYWFGRDLK